MNQPYYPVPFEAFTKNFNFHTINEGEPINLGNAKRLPELRQKLRLKKGKYTVFEEITKETGMKPYTLRHR